MHRSQLKTIVIDCPKEQFEASVKFWSQLLGKQPTREPIQDHRYIPLEGQLQDVRILLQAVEGPAEIHLDIESDNIKAEAVRTQSLGATPKGAVEYWQVMQAPSGHAFCIIDETQETGLTDDAAVWDSSAEH